MFVCKRLKWLSGSKTGKCGTEIIHFVYFCIVTSILFIRMSKKNIILLIAIIFAVAARGQIITTNPAIFTQSSGSVEIIYDASQGNKGLMGFTGDVYAHTGVTSNLGDWRYAPVWGDNAAKYKLTSMGNNKWKLVLSPSVFSYYGMQAGEKATRLSFVFRSADKTKEGKAAGNQDIFVDIFQEGFNVAFTNPASDKSVTVGITENIEIVASSAANLELFVNGESKKTANAATSLSHSFTYSQTIDYQLIAKATSSGVSKYDTVNVCVPAPVVNEARPAGYKDGINYSANGTQATLILYAPNKQSVFVIGDFSNWTQQNKYQMKKDGNYWWLTLTDLTPGKLYGFQYLVDNTLRVSDPYTELVLDPWNDKWINEKMQIYPNLPAYPEGKTTGLVATLQSNKPAYNWEISNFAVQNPDNLVIYEMLLRDFTTERSLQAAIQRLDYLQTLGVTAIELMPVQEFDGNDSWGYNPNHFFAPDKAYGTSEMYKKFVDECHKRGMAVILDMVFNHATGINTFAMLYWDSTNNRPASNNPWMNPSAPHQFSVYNDFNHSFTGTREYFNRVLQYWITEYKVDGYRMDLTKGFTQSSGTESTYDAGRVSYLSEYYDAVKAVKPDAVFILEHFVGGAEEDYLASKGMYLWRNMNYAYSQAAMGFNSGADFNGMNSSPRKWIGYAESHDEERNFYKAKSLGDGIVKTDSLARVGRVPLNIAFTTLTPGPKMVWQFGEMGFDYSIESLGGRTSPKPSAFTWLNLPHRKAAYDKSAKIISLKKLFPKAFTEGNYQLNVGGGDWSSGKRIAITHNDLNMVMLGNFQASGSTTAYPNFSKSGNWYELLSGETLNVSNTNMTLTLNAGDVKIYTDRIVDPNSNTENTMVSNLTVYPRLGDGKLWIATSDNVVSVSLYNAQGSLVRNLGNTKEVNFTDCAAGIYLLEVVTNQGSVVEKVVKR